MINPGGEPQVVYFCPLATGAHNFAASFRDQIMLTCTRLPRTIYGSAVHTEAMDKQLCAWTHDTNKLSLIRSMLTSISPMTKFLV